jgi:hypothetical protein
MLRRVDHRDWGIYGVLIGPAGPFIVTLELPWNDNQQRKSSIPAGVYRCKRVQSPRFGNTFEITGVPGRSAILFHGGNSTADTLGCVLTGTTFDPVGGMNGKNGVTGSKLAFDELMDMLRDVDEFTLHVSNS